MVVVTRQVMVKDRYVEAAPGECSCKRYALADTRIVPLCEAEPPELVELARGFVTVAAMSTRAGDTNEQLAFHFLRQCERTGWRTPGIQGAVTRAKLTHNLLRNRRANTFALTAALVLAAAAAVRRSKL